VPIQSDQFLESPEPDVDASIDPCYKHGLNRFRKLLYLDPAHPLRCMKELILDEP